MPQAHFQEVRNVAADGGRRSLPCAGSASWAYFLWQDTRDRPTLEGPRGLRDCNHPKRCLCLNQPHATKRSVGLGVGWGGCRLTRQGNSSSSEARP